MKMTPKRIAVLRAVWSVGSGGATVPEASRRAGRLREYARPALQRLHEAGLVEWADPVAARRRITPKGRAALKEHEEKS